MKIKTYLAIVSACLLILGLSCAAPTPSPVPAPQPTPSQTPALPVSIFLPTEDGMWAPPESHVGRKATGTGTITIGDIGDFTFDTSQVQTLRPDIFQPGHFSLFDILVHLAERGDIKLVYHFDGHMDTHLIDAINGEPHWWYEAHYSRGWYESNVFRMDMYPYKNDTEIRVFQQSEDRRARICRTFGEEVVRLAQNGGQVVIPEVTLGHKIFEDVKVTAHGVRADILQPGVVTALDILLSLGEQGELSRLKLTWYDRIARANPVDSYWVEQIDMGDGFNDDEAQGGCGWVYETGPRAFSGFAGSHIHIPLDVRVIVSPEYAFWFWICL